MQEIIHTRSWLYSHSAETVTLVSLIDQLPLKGFDDVDIWDELLHVLHQLIHRRLFLELCKNQVADAEVCHYRFLNWLARFLWEGDLVRWCELWWGGWERLFIFLTVRPAIRITWGIALRSVAAKGLVVLQPHIRITNQQEKRRPWWLICQ